MYCSHCLRLGKRTEHKNPNVKRICVLQVLLESMEGGAGKEGQERRGKRRIGGARGEKEEQEEKRRSKRRKGGA